MIVGHATMSVIIKIITSLVNKPESGKSTMYTIDGLSLENGFPGNRFPLGIPSHCLSLELTNVIVQCFAFVATAVIPKIAVGHIPGVVCYITIYCCL